MPRNRIEAYLTEARGLSIRDRLAFVERIPEPNVGPDWYYDTYSFSLPQVTGAELTVQAVAQEEIYRDERGSVTKIIAGLRGERLSWFEEKTPAGRHASIAGEKIVVISIADPTTSTAAGFDSEVPTVFINPLAIVPVTSDRLSWSFESLQREDCWMPLGTPLPPRMAVFQTAIKAAEEKFRCRRCQSGEPLCLHWVH